MLEWIIFGAIVLAIFVFLILPSILAENKVAKNNGKFHLYSEVRVIRENKGTGDYYYPQFAFDDEWFYFQETWGAFNPSVENKRFGSVETCNDFIRNKKAESRPEFEIIKESRFGKYEA